MKSIIYIFVLVFIYVKIIENTAVFYPTRRVEATPQLKKLPFREVYLPVYRDVKINAWFIPAANASFTILLCHGNAGNLSHRLEKIALLHNLGTNIFIFDYRGYGKSGGSPGEKNFYIDAKTAWEYLRDKEGIAEKNIIIYGESIGSAVAIDLASKVEAAGLIAETAFTSIRDMGKKNFPFIPSFLVSDRFNSLKKIKQVSCPKLFIASIDDEIVPFAMTKKLYEYAPEPKTMAVIKGSHNEAFLDSVKDYTKAIAYFIESLRSPGEAKAGQNIAAQTTP